MYFQIFLFFGGRSYLLFWQASVYILRKSSLDKHSAFFSSFFSPLSTAGVTRSLLVALVPYECTDLWDVSLSIRPSCQYRCSHHPVETECTWPSGLMYMTLRTCGLVQLSFPYLISSLLYSHLYNSFWLLVCISLFLFIHSVHIVFISFFVHFYLPSFSTSPICVISMFSQVLVFLWFFSHTFVQFSV